MGEPRNGERGSGESEWQANVGATVQQLVFSDRAWANKTIQKNLRVQRDEDVRRSALDISKDAGVAYLNVLLTKTLESIQRENIKVTRTNLDLARSRVRVGTANTAEVYRWEAQIANDRSAVISASAQRRATETNFNRVLNRPIEETFTLEDITLDSRLAFMSNPALAKAFSGPQPFHTFRLFMTDEAAAASPELAGIRAGLVAQERAVKSAWRSFYTPEIGLQGVDPQLAAAGGGYGRPVI